MPFVKYHGSGNDFIMVDDRERRFDLTGDQIVKLCHRHFGIGSDGIIFLRHHDDCDFEMVFFNPDGSQSLCGNGGRCSVDFAFELGVIGEHCRFMAVDGPHDGMIEGQDRCIRLHDISEVKRYGDGYFLHNGSPHFVTFVQDLGAVDVVAEGRKIRYDDRFQPGGTNVSFVSMLSNGIASRVYERGVENETFSSGTGTTAQAICARLHGKSPSFPLTTVHTKGGELKVSFQHDGKSGFSDIWLKGRVVRVYAGEVSL